MGILYGAVAASGDNTAASSESVTISTVADIIAFGIKDSATSALPGQTGSLFLGVTSANGTVSNTFGTGTGFSSNQGNPMTLSATGYAGVTKIGGTNSESTAGMDYPTDTSVSSSYNGFFALKFVINNLGLSSQTVTISNAHSTPVSGTDYSAGALRTLINNGTYTNARTIAWNDGAAARDIPDACWIRMPFYSNRIRLSQPAPMLVRYAP